MTSSVPYLWCYFFIYLYRNAKRETILIWNWVIVKKGEKEEQVGYETKARFTQVKFFNGYPSNYILKTNFWPTIKGNIKQKLVFIYI